MWCDSRGGFLPALDGYQVPKLNRAHILRQYFLDHDNSSAIRLLVTVANCLQTSFYVRIIVIDTTGTDGSF
ncbi:hypothetical protein V2G26_019783 [Clonostachys chloroleuca]